MVIYNGKVTRWICCLGSWKVHLSKVTFEEAVNEEEVSDMWSFEIIFNQKTNTQNLKIINKQTENALEEKTTLYIWATERKSLWLGRWISGRKYKHMARSDSRVKFVGHLEGLGNYALKTLLWLLYGKKIGAEQDWRERREILV